MVKKINFILIMMVLLVFSFLFSINFVSAFSVFSVTPSYINRTAPTLINITINNTDAVNITQLTFTLPMEARFYGGNSTNANGGVFFSNATGGIPPQITLIFANTTATPGLIGNTSQIRSFLFNITMTNLQSAFFTNISIAAKHISGADTQTSYNMPVYFEFSGYTMNETGGAERNSNVSIYQFAEGQNGPPTQTLEASTVSDSNGMFRFLSLNGSVSTYTLKIIRYGPATGCISLNTTCNATKISTILPPFPPLMYYPTSADNAFAFAFMRPPSLNGTSFYLQPAAIIRLNAHNISAVQKFGYEVMDQGTGFPIESNIMNSVATKDIVVPTGRNMTVMFTRMPFGSNSFSFSPNCDGSFMNDSDCPTPPISNSTIGTLVQGQITLVNQSLIISKYRLWGCINVTLGSNNSDINVTAIIPKMVPWPGFVPPIRSDMGDLNLTNQAQLNRSDPRCPGTLAYFNISVIGAAGGINYLVEIYAKNASNDSGNPGTAWNLGAFQNVSITGNKNINISLTRLTGAYQGTQSDANTSKMKINIQNATGGAITNSMNANVKVKHPVFGTITYMIESMSSGTFYIPILNNSNWAKIMVYANDAPPKEITLNLSVNENNITLVTMSDGNGVGMKRINATGGMQMINSSELNDTKSINMRFLRNSAACNVLEPDSSCAITNTSAKNFNPLLAMVAGKVNMELKITATNVTLTFMNFDMFAAKQPPMDSIMNDNPSSGASSANQVWQFGSFAPINTYDYAIIAMPYQDNVINDTLDINMSIPYFYDENWNLIWSATRGDTSTNLTDDFIDYNSSSLYNGYLSAGGINCSKVDTNLNVTPCFVNTTSNMLYMRVPHFSGVGDNIIGTAPLTVAAATTVSSGGGGAASTWTSTKVLSDAEFRAGASKDLGKNERAKVSIYAEGTSGVTEPHYIGITAITSTSATIEISSTPQTAVLNIGDEKKFDANSDKYYDLSVKLNSITNNKANITIKSLYEKIPEQTTTPSAPPAETTTPPSTTPTTEGKTNQISWGLWVVIAVIVVIILIYYFMNKRKKDFYVVYKRKR